jgi:hypothetical protein
MKPATRPSLSGGPGTQTSHVRPFGRTSPLDGIEGNVAVNANSDGRARIEPVEATVRIIDDWPALVSVTADEIDVLETFLNGLLDEILGGKHA